MIYRPEDDHDFDIEAYWKRKQSPKENKVRGEAPLAGADRDAERAQSNWKSEGGKSQTGKDLGTIWDEEPWKDKENK